MSRDKTVHIPVKSDLYVDVKPVGSSISMLKLTSELLLNQLFLLDSQIVRLTKNLIITWLVKVFEE